MYPRFVRNQTNFLFSSPILRHLRKVTSNEKIIIPLLFQSQNMHLLTRKTSKQSFRSSSSKKHTAQIIKKQIPFQELKMERSILEIEKKKQSSVKSKIKNRDTLSSRPSYKQSKKKASTPIQSQSKRQSLNSWDNDFPQDGKLFFPPQINQMVISQMPPQIQPQITQMVVSQMPVHKKAQELQNEKRMESLIKLKRNKRLMYTKTSSFNQNDRRNSKGTAKEIVGQLKLKKELNISAKHFLVIEKENSRILYSEKAFDRVEIASLTKIMTCLCILHLADQQGLKIDKQFITISHTAEKVFGTTADLNQGQIYTVEQLLYALMLPSGNDAAIMLAEWAGKIIYSQESPTKQKKIISFIDLFIDYMNKCGFKWGLKNSRWNNPHGLSDCQNYSTAHDLAKLSCFGLNDHRFAKIVSTQIYTCETINEAGNPNKIEWENTNNLLQRNGFTGIKTGITQSAGPCLIVSYASQGHTLIAVLLRCSSKRRRDSDALRLLKNCSEEWSKEKKSSESIELLRKGFIKMLKGDDEDDEVDED